MQIPLIGKKVDGRTSLILGTIAASVLVVSGGAYIAINRPTQSQSEITALTVPVKVATVTPEITSSGTVVPVQTVNLSPKTSGRIAELRVEQGDKVLQGQILARMDNEDIQAQLVQAKAQLEQAKANLAKARAGSRPEEIAQARSRVAQMQAQLAAARAGSRPEEIAQARARVAQVQAQLAAARAGSRPEEIAQARSRVAQAQAQLSAAQTANPQQIAAARSQVESAQARLDLAQERVNRYQKLQQEGAITRDRLDEVLTEFRTSRSSLEEAKRRLAQVQNGTSPAEINQRQAALREAQQALELLQNGTRKEDITQREAAVREAQKALELVQNGTRKEDIAQREAAVREAQQALDLLLSGSRAEDIAQAEAKVKEAQARVQQVQVQVEDTIIRAPFEGIITQKYANVGAFVTPTTSGSNTAAATSTSIVALARGLEILAKVPEVNIGEIKQQQPVNIKADAYPDKVFKGRVRLIAPEAIVDQNVTSFQIRVTLDTGLDELRSGMNVDLALSGKEVANAFVVPMVAIVNEKGKTGVLVPGKENKPEFRAVTTGVMIDDQIQILDGLQEGDRVFIDLPKDRRPKPES